MDTSTCPFGYATDHVMLCDPTIRCDANFIAYVATLSTIILLRIIVVILQYRQWSAREQRASAAGRIGTTAAGLKSHIKGKRQPVTVFIGIFTVIVFTIFTVLTSLNIIGCGTNYYSSAPFYWLLWVPINTTNGIFMRRLGRLGRALLPLARAELTLSAENEQRITQEDVLLRILNVLFFISLFGKTLVWIIIAPVFAGNSIPSTAGMACIGGLHLSACSAYTWQLQRLIHIAQKSPSRDIDGGKINTAIATLRLRQRFIILVGFSTGFVWFLCGIQVYPFNYIVVCAHMSTDILAVVGFMIRASSRKNTSSTTPTSTTANGGKVAEGENDNKSPGSFRSSVNNKQHISLSNSNNTRNSNNKLVSVNVRENNNGSMISGSMEDVGGGVSDS
jgi:hypothetical protein